MKRIRQVVSYLLKTKQEKRHSLVGAGNLWKMKRDFQIKFLLDQELKKTDKLLDIGCGTLRGGIPIIEYLNAQNYYGIDVREETIIEARKELKAFNLESKKPTLFSFDHFGNIKLEESMDVMFAFSVLIHLKDDIVENCFKFVSKYLDAKGVFYANVNIGKSTEGNWQGFPVVFRSLDFYKDLALRNSLKVEVIGNLKELGHDSGKKSDVQQQMLKFYKV